jgi:hypothetical protein
MLERKLRTPEPGLFVGQIIVPMQGTFSFEAFRQAWALAAERFTFLRTSLDWETVGQPVQVVHRAGRVETSHADLRGLDEQEQWAGIEGWLHADRERMYDPKESCSLRLLAAQRSDTDFDLVLSSDYMRTDGWSLGIELSYFLNCYIALVEGTPLPDDDDPPDYRHYVEWLVQQDEEAARRHWTAALRGADFRWPLVPEVDNDVGHARLDEYLGREVTARLREAARRLQVPFSTIVFAAWAEILSRWSGRRDILFGVNVAGRPASVAGVDRMVGVFINVLPFRVRSSEGDDPSTMVGLVEDGQIKLKDHDWVSLRKVKQWLGVDNAKLLFDSYIVFQNLPAQGSEVWLKDTEEDVPFADAQMEYPLRVTLVPEASMLIGFTYYRRCFTQERIQQLMHDYKAVLAEFAELADGDSDDRFELRPAATVVT